MKPIILLMYPPGPQYQRGENRSQGNIEDSTATAMRACNDLGYCAAVLERLGYTARIRDYQTEGKSYVEMAAEIKQFQPNLLLMSITNATIVHDLEIAKRIKADGSPVVVLKGAFFYDIDPEKLTLLDLGAADFLIGGEEEQAIQKIAMSLFEGSVNLESIKNVFYKDATGSWIKNAFDSWIEKLDELPFPARHLMNNGLYVRPDTGETMATIQTSRGCSSGCIFCLSPKLSGKKIRTRSPGNVFLELRECYYKYGIKSFFFRADTFTMDPKWVSELCNRIIASDLYENIHFTVNSRVRPLTRETLELLKRAGCFAVAFGFESGSSETLLKINKGATIQENLQAAKWAHELKIPIYGFFIIGFPWENNVHLEATKRHIFEIEAEFIEVHIATPYYGTKLFEICKTARTISNESIGFDYYNSSIDGTAELSIDELLNFKVNLIKSYYFRGKYILARLRENVYRPSILKQYVFYALKLYKNLRRQDA